MDEKLKNICELLVRNYEEMKAAEADKKVEFMAAGAGVFTADDVLIDIDRLEAAKAVIDKKDGFFDDYRSRAAFIVLCKLAVAENPDAYFEQLMETCMALQTGKLYTESNNILSSIILLDGLGDENFEHCEDVAERSKGIFRLISEGSKGIPSDMPFAVIAAVNGREPEDMFNDEKAAKNYIKKAITVDNVTSPSMAKCIALTDGDVIEKCSRVCDIVMALKKAKCSTGQGRVNILLSLASYLDLDNDEMVSEIVAADSILKKYKPFKGLTGVEPEFRRLMAILCVMIRYDQTGGALARHGAIMAVYITLLNATRAF